ISYAAQVVRESMKTPAARHMGVPSIPLTDLYNKVGDYIRAHGGEILFRTSLQAFSSNAPHVQIRITDQDKREREESFDHLILALPFNTVGAVLPQTPDAAPLHEDLTHFESCPITGIHLWFDRQITELDHAVLLDRTIQWMFHKSRLLTTRAAADSQASGSYIELVVSASKSLIDRSRPEIVDLALKEVREFFPVAREATLLKSAVIKEVHATYSPRPGIDAYRPSQSTPWPQVFLAGDWTATGWPATMEGAVRSGYLAAEALIRVAGANSKRFLAPDLPASGFMRLFT
ncbi:MAG: FAD-dependent oxidoreductase, partial [Candidatus Sulfotelmatobacter sp.]